MAVFKYTWGTERPKVKETRHLRNITEAAEARRAALRKAYEDALAAVEEDVEEEKKELELVRLSTPGGRYNSEIAISVATKFGIVADGAPVKRGPGRPRKYGPSDQRPPRPSRAKTSAGRLRAASSQFAAARSPRKAAPREASGTVSSVTSSSARTFVPKISPEIGRALLESTIAGSQAVDAITPEAIRIEVSVNDTSITVETSVEPSLPVIVEAQETPESEKALPAERPLPSFFQNTGFDQEFQDELDAAELEEALQQHFLSNLNPKEWYRGDGGAFKHKYDFSDPYSREGAGDEVVSLFPGFGLSTHSPTYDRENPENGMKEEDLLEWLKVTTFADDKDGEELERCLFQYRGPRGIYKTFKRTIEPSIEEERMRLKVWRAVESRLRYVERHYDDYKTYHGDLDLALVRVAHRDYQNTGLLSDAEQAIFYRVIDAMTWVEGFSRLDMAKWAGADLSIPHWNRTHERFPYWLYPERLHGFVMAGRDEHDREEWARHVEYTPPTIEELRAFMKEEAENRVLQAEERKRVAEEYFRRRSLAQK